MKRWCKLSLVVLTIPLTVGGIALVTVACYNPILIIEPKLISKPKIAGEQKNIFEWWSRFKTIEEKIAALKANIFIKDTKLTARQVKNINLITTPKTMFQIILKPKHVFDKDKKDIWISDSKVDIIYIQEIKIPFPTFNQNFGGTKSLATWIKEMNQATKNIDTFDFATLFSDAILDKSNTESISLVQKNDSKFNVTITLKSPYLFEDGKAIWTSKHLYNLENQVVAWPQIKMNHTGSRIFYEWIQEKQKEFNNLEKFDFRSFFSKFSLDGKNAINSKNTEKIEIKEIEPNAQGDFQFEVTVFLKPGFVFKDETPIWKSEPATYLLRVNYPNMAAGIIMSKQSTITEWWNSLETKLARVQELNKLLTKESQLDPRIVENINLLNNNGIKFEVELKKGNVFNNQTNKWTSSRKVRYYSEIDNPRPSNTNWCTKASLKDWIIATNLKSIDYKIKTLFKDNTLTPTNTKSILVKADEQKPNSQFIITVTLNDDYVFPKCEKVWSSKPLGYLCQRIQPQFAKTRIIEKYQNAEEWWSSFREPLARIQAFNELLTDRTKLNPEEAVDVELIPVSKKFKATLTDGYVFEDNGQVWISPKPIIYDKEVSEPQAVQTTYGKALLETWVVNQNEKLKDLKNFDFKQLFSNDALNSENTKAILLSSQDANHFSIGINLNNGFAFLDGKNEKTITGIPYHLEIPTPELIDQPIINELPDNYKKWWSSFISEEERVIKLNQLFKPNTTLSPIHVKDTNLVDVDENTFKVEFNLHKFHSFKDKQSVWTSPLITYQKSKLVIQPELVNNPTVVKTYIDAITWWKNLDERQKLSQFNQLLTPNTQMKSEEVEKITLLQNEDVFVVKLKPGYSFINNTNTWKSAKFNYYRVIKVKQPTDFINFNSPLSFDNWIDEMNKKLNKLEEFNFKELFNEPNLNVYNTKIIKLIKCGNNTFKISVITNPRYVFKDANGALTKSWESDELNYTVLLSKPNFKNRPINISGQQGDILSWWNELGDLRSKVLAFNKLLDEKTQLDPDSVSDIDIFSKENDQKQFTLSLKEQYTFENSQKTWFSDETFIYFQQLQLPTINDENNVSVQGTHLDPQAWWKTLTSLQAKIDLVNHLFNPKQLLTQENTSSIEMVDVNGNQFSLVINLKPKFKFSNDKNEAIVGKIKYQRILKPKVYPPKYLSGGVNQPIVDYVEQFNETSLEQKERYFLTEKSDYINFAGKIKNFILIPRDNNFIDWQLVLNDEYTFEDGSKILNSTNPIPYNWQYDIPRLKRSIAPSISSASEFVSTFQNKSLEEKIISFFENGKENLNPVGIEEVSLLAKDKKVIIKVNLKANFSVKNMFEYKHSSNEISSDGYTWTGEITFPNP